MRKDTFTSIKYKNYGVVTPNMFKKKDSIEGVDLNQQPSTAAKFLIVIGNTVPLQHFETTNASITILDAE